MSEKHVKYTMAGTTTNEVMNNIFSFVSSSGQNAIRFAYSGTATSVSSTLGYGGSPSVTNFASGSFIVIEPVTAMPSGYRWQVKIENISTSQIGATLSSVGGWEGNSTKNFISSSVNNPPGITPPVTDRVVWLNATPSAGFIYLISSADLDTYGASAIPSSYFRIVEWQASAAEGSQFVQALHVGGYIPTNQVSNTNPVAMLARNPGMTVSTSYWGNTSTVNTTTLNRVPPDYNFSTTNLSNSTACISTVAGNAAVPGALTWAKDLNGNWVNFPVFIFSTTAAATMGYYGKYAMFGGYSGRQDGQSDAANEYLVVNDLVIRWKPSA